MSEIKVTHSRSITTRMENNHVAVLREQVNGRDATYSATVGVEKIRMSRDSAFLLRDLLTKLLFVGEDEW